jgi:acetyl-CoA carboxylase biotin carboxyl carrier protein
MRENGMVTIDSPMVGTFYSASAPGKPAFVLPGDTVEPNQTVCIVEAMKIMNEVVSKLPMIIEKVLVENGEPVEFGQPLFMGRPLI